MIIFNFPASSLSFLCVVSFSLTNNLVYHYPHILFFFVSYLMIFIQLQRNVINNKRYLFLCRLCFLLNINLSRTDLHEYEIASVRVWTYIWRTEFFESFWQNSPCFDLHLSFLLYSLVFVFQFYFSINGRKVLVGPVPMKKWRRRRSLRTFNKLWAQIACIV